MIGMVLALMVLAAGCSQQQIDQTVEQTGKALTRAKDAGFEATAIVIVDPSFACVGFGILSKSMGIVIIQGHVAGIVPPTTQPADQP
jgi:hypothetical protein